MRRYVLLIDCADESFEAGQRFWAEALRAPAEPDADPAGPYVAFPAATGEVKIDVQRVGAPSRYHLDLHCDDVDAEADRLVALGAERVERQESWWVLRAPTGHLFCVIPNP